MGCKNNSNGVCLCEETLHEEIVERAYSENRKEFECYYAEAEPNKCLCGEELEGYQEHYEAWGKDIFHTYIHCPRCGDDSE